MEIYDLKIDSMRCGGVSDSRNPRFSWKMRSDKQGTVQKFRTVIVAGDEEFNNIVWSSGRIEDSCSQNIRCEKELEPERKYYIRVTIGDNYGEVSETEGNFLTSLLSNDRSAWSGAEWIGSPVKTVNTDGVDTYRITYDVSLAAGNTSTFVIAARNKDNCVKVVIAPDNSAVKVISFYDNEWTDNLPEIKELCSRCSDKISYENHVVITVNKKNITVAVNGADVISDAAIFGETKYFEPRKEFMLNIGIDQTGSKAVYDNIKIENHISAVVYQEDGFEDESTVLSSLGNVCDGKLVVENRFELVTSVPSVNVRKIFDIKKPVARAYMYSSAHGFYIAYMNGKRVNKGFYDPGFTDYRKKIFYQMFDVTDLISEGRNVIGATVAKGYYTGYVGYHPVPMVYGEMNAFLCRLRIEYADGTQEIIVSNGSWSFTDKGAVVNSDYLQGEIYDARMEFDWSDIKDSRWKKCGIIPWRESVTATNGGELKKERFEMALTEGDFATIERTLKPIQKPWKTTENHFVYDMGQNMVGTIRLHARAKRDVSINIRYGEMCRRDGRVYVANLRSAANTDTYTFKGDSNGEIFVPSYTSHGFRYVEIYGNGYELTENDIEIISIEGLVITNTCDITGGFECSDENINQLYSNIQWGQRGNSLLVFTDCPQRNERMGWTGDAQVFAATAAYNMDIKPFMNKWLSDLREAQLMYNRNGAVPDTAPLGGDNRPLGGCSGWGDAAVIVPWEMYKAYGDTDVLEKNYEMMRRWIDYLNLPERRGYGIRIVDGKEVKEKSDLSSVPYIQCQQSRGDHLAYDESTPFILSATAYAARSCFLFVKTAELLGKTEDVKKYSEIYENIKRAFNEAWVQPDGSIAYWGEQSRSGTDQNGNVINRTYYSERDGSGARPSQTAYALAIDFDLIPKEKMSRAAECFKASVDERGGKLSVGFLGISHLAPALSKVGLHETAYSLLLQDKNPSWLYSVKNGATTIWERWNSYTAETDTFGDVSMNSFNHYAYGSIGEWLIGAILGINTSCKSGEAGYKRIILAPVFSKKLEYVSGYHDSPYGIIRSEWVRDGEKVTYRCEIPPNTTALLHIGGDIKELSSGRYEFWTEI